MNIITLDESEVKDLDALELMADELARLTGGGEIKVKSVIMIETENMPAYFLLRDLLKGKAFEEIPATTVREQFSEQARKYGAKKQPDYHKPLPTAPERKLMRAWRILDGSGHCIERITIDEKNRRLAKGEFQPGTILHHPKAGRMRVTGDFGTGQGIEPLEGGAG